MKTILSLLAISLDAAFCHASAPVVSDKANLSGKEYVNPVIHADYSDPDAVASPDGKTFYMTASSFQSTPGLPILKSTDLVNWTLVNHALPAVPPKDFYSAAPRHGKGVWAPSIRCHAGEYYIYWGDPDFGVFMIKTENPEDKWSEPVLVMPGKGIIDPVPFWDEDGKTYLANGWAASRCGFNSVITLSELNTEGTAVISNPKIIFDGNDGVNHTIEGPKVYKRNGWYYLFAPAGGVATGWQFVARSKNIYGPYEAKIVMAQGSTDINGPHQGAWVSTADGEDWFLHFQDKGPYGRVIHLNPLKWVNDWPVIGYDKDGDGCGEPVRKWRKPSIASTSSDLRYNSKDAPELYQWHANYDYSFGFPSQDSMMRIYGDKLSEEFVNFWEVPNLWLKKFPAEKFTMTAKVRISAKGNSEDVDSGIIVMGWDYARLGLVKKGDAFELRYTECADAEQGSPEKIHMIGSLTPTRVYEAGLYPNMECDLTFRVKVGNDGICQFSYSPDGLKFIEIPYKFKARAGKWIGAKVGFYSVMPSNTSEKGWIDVKEVVTETL